MPIFTEDGLDPRMLVEACVAAGCKVIEYTFRKRDAATMIPWIRQNYPDLFILVGSILDSPDLITTSRRYHPQLLSVDDLAEIGVDGFISMLGLRPETVKQYSNSHLLIIPCHSMGEAYHSLTEGAHFIKLIGPDLDLVKLCRNVACFDSMPIFVTGGMSLDRIAPTVESGAVLVGSGFQIILEGMDSDPRPDAVAEAIRARIEKVRETRASVWPALAEVEETDGHTWLNALPHHHPFQDMVEDGTAS